MDTLTHIALGACIGEAVAGKQLGRKAMLWGALVQSLPDVDFIAHFWMDPASSLLAHRGFTHSFLFVFIAAPFIALVANRIHKRLNISLKSLILFFGIELIVHLFIDVFNNYGVGWFEPFSHHRFSFNTIYVADPFFSLAPIICFAILIFKKKRSSKRKFWWRAGLLIPAIYLVYCSMNKIKINDDVQAILKKQNIPQQKYFTTPAPLQNWLWYVVSGNDTGYYVGFRSLFDSKKEIDFTFFPKNDSLLNAVHNDEEVQKLKRFSQSFYTVEYWNDTLVFNDVRFGQIIGWQNNNEKFVFHYYLKKSADNEMVVQRGRFAKWDWEVVKNFITRIRGN